MSLDITVHKNILIKILKDIYTNTSLGVFLGFKGGTAAYLFYDLGRFSVDLDFDLLDEKKEEEIFEKIGEIVEKYGEIKEKRNKKHTLFILLSYSDLEESRNIKIEINKRNFGSKYEVKNYLGISMLVMRKEDMFAHKLVAMIERNRTTNRDIFDVWFFLKNNWEINKEIVEERTEMKFDAYLRKCVKFIEKLPERGILSGMGELLDEKQEVWVKTKIKDDVLFLLKLMLDSNKK